MNFGISKNHHTRSADTGLVLLVFFLLSLVDHVHSDETREKLLARKFAPILVLTEHPTISGRIVLNPEPVEIMGADSLSNVTVISLNTSGSAFLRASYLADWNPPLNFPGVDASRNQFAFLTTQRRYYDGIRPGENSKSINMWVKPLFFDYPGDDRASWNPAYLGTGGDDSRAGWRFRNTVYARVFQRPDSSDGKGSVFITYFTFYPFNDWKNNHEGDWQKINVMVTSRDPDSAKIFGIDYLFHGQSITYYDITNSLSSINIEERVSPVGGDHPVVYVSAGGHGSYPTPGKYPDAGEIVASKGVADDLTPNGLVLHPEIIDSETAIAQSYDLVMLPQPDRTLANMGLPDSMSWLGADLFWGTPEVASPADWLPNEFSPKKLEKSNDAAVSPFHKGSWGQIRYDKSNHNKYDPTKIPSDYERFHNFPIVGNVTWSGKVSLRGDIVVFPGATLIIKKGTVVEFEPKSDIHKFPAKEGSATYGVDDRAEIFVYGTLIARGRASKADSVRFGGTWGGIRVMRGGTAKLRHTEILGAPPAAPKDLTAASGDGQAVLRWADPYPDDPSITGYQYSFRRTPSQTPRRGSRSQSAEDTWSAWVDVSASRRDTTVTGLTNGTRYTFALRAVNGEPGASSTATVTPARVPGVPELVSTESLNRQIALTWSAPESDGGSSLTGYEVRWSSDDGSSWGPGTGDGWKAVHPDPTGSGPFRFDTPDDLTNNRKYLLEVRAVNALGAGAAVGVTAYPGGTQITGEANVDYAENGTDVVATYRVSSSSSAYTWSVVGTDADGFTIDESGRMGFKVSPDFETPGDDGSDNVYDVRVKATPGGVVGAVDPGVLFLPVAVTVTDAEEAGKVHLPSTAPQVGTAVTATLSDPDGGVSGASWQWQRRLATSKTWDAVGKVQKQAAGSYVPQMEDADFLLRATVLYSDRRGAGKSAFGRAGTVQVSGAAVPSAPKRLQAFPGDGRMVLTWAAADPNGSDIRHYRVRYSSADEQTRIPWTPVEGGASARKHTVKGLTNNTTYTFYVKARNGAGNGEEAEVEATPQRLPVPEGGSAVSGWAEVAVSWSPVAATPAVSGYDLQGQSKPVSGGSWPSTWTDLLSNGSGTLKNSRIGHTHASLNPDRVYRYRVRSVRGEEMSAWSALLPGAAGVQPQPGRVSGLTARRGDRQVNLAWTGPVHTHITGWKVRSGAIAGQDTTWAVWGPISGGTASTRAHSVRSLTNGTEYTFQVRAVNGGGDGAPSKPTGSVTPAGVPGPPEDLVAAPGKKMEMVLSWSAPSRDNGSALTEYEVRRSRNGGASWGNWTGTGSTSLSHTLSSLSSGAYTFQVRAVNGVGEGTASRQATGAWFLENGTQAAVSYPSGPGQVWTLAGADAGDFSIRQGALSFDSAPNFEKPVDADTDNVYQVRVEARDPTPSLRAEVRVRVQGVEEPGEVTLSSVAPQVGTRLQATLSDPDGGPQNPLWFWEKSSSSLSGQSDEDEEQGNPQDTYMPKAGDVGKKLRVRVNYTDDHGSNLDRAESVWTAAVIGVPCAPKDLQASPGNAQVSLSWSAPDCDGGSEITKYEYKRGNGDWSPVSGGGSARSQTVTSLTNGTRYTFSVRAVNKVGGGAEASKSATPQTLVISGPSSPSFAENGIGTVATYSLTGHGTETVTWSVEGTDKNRVKIDGSGRLKFRSAPDYEDPTDEDGDNAYEVRVKAVAGVLEKTKSVTVQVTGVEEGGKVTLSSYAPQVGTRLQATLNDSDGGETAKFWFWDRSSSSLSGQSDEDEDEEQDGPREYETPQPTDVGKKLRVRVIYTDNHGSNLDRAQSAWTAAVIGVPCAPKNLSAAAGNAQVTLRWSTPDCDGGSAITKYEYQQDSGDWLPVSGGGSARSQTVTSLTNGTAYTFTVRAVNKVGGGAEASKSATPRTLVISGPSAPSFAENGTGNVAAYTASGHGAATVIWSVEGTDKDQLKIDGSGRLTFRSAPDYEDPDDSGDNNTYDLRVKAVAGGLEKTKTVAVRVTGVEEGGKVTLSSYAPQVGTRLQATLSDSDGGETVRFWYWDRSSSSLSGAEGDVQGQSQGGPRDYETPRASDVGKKLRARVSYTDDHGSNLDNAQSIWTAAVIGVPCAPKSLTAAAGNAQVTLRWSTPDCDGGSSITKYEYKRGNGDWATVSGGGSARSQTVTKLTNGTAYTFSVRAVNKVGAGASASKSATPRTLVISGPSSPSFAENGTGTISTYSASGHGRTTVTWSVEGTDAGKLTIDGSGRLKFRSAPDYEDPDDSGDDNTYDLRVKAVAGGLEKTKTVAVRVTGVEEGGKVTLSSVAPQVGTRLQATLSDSDGGETVRFWYWDRSSSSLSGAEGDAQGQSQGGPRDYETPRASDVGKKLRARVTYTDDHGSNLDQAQSVWTAAVIGVPCAPKNLSASSGNARVTLRWSTPDCDGGSSITKYEYKRGSGDWSTVSGGSSARSQAVTSLTNGTRYTFYVRAVNKVGGGAEASKSATPRTLAISGSSSPSFAENGTGTVATYSASGHGGTTVTWSVEGTDAGELTIDGSGRLKFRSAPDYEDPDDSGGDNTYDLRVKAVAGSLEKTKTVAVRVTGVEEGGKVTLSSTKPQVGTRLRATLSDPDDGERVRFWFWDKSSTSLSGQADEGGPRDYYTPQAGDVGKKLRARVTYTDNHGSNQDNAQSAWTSAVIGTPCAPKSLQATAGNGRVTLRWSTPDCDGGSSITKYEYKQGSGDWSTVSGGGSARSQTVTNLTNGTRYTFTVRAVNGVGSGATASKSATPAGLPGRPGSLSATAGNGSVTLRWSAAATNGSAITKYEYKQGSGNWSTVSGGGSARSKTVTGLRNGTRYTFSVRAVNGVGAGSSVSKSATPAGLPGRPSLSATAGSGRVTLRWGAASSNGSSITKYEYKRGSGGWSTVSGGGSARSRTVTGLRNGTRYTFSVRAVNGVGAGSSASVSATPAGVPGAPQNLRASTGIGRVTLTWGAASSNGSAITKYEYKRGSGGWSTVSGGASARRQTVTGLTGGFTYTFYVRAVNGVGAGASASRSAIPIDDFALKSNHPNPFNAETRLHYALPSAQWVRLTIYDMLGRVVRTLVDQEQPPGWHQIIWDGRDESGREVASGIYFYRFQTPKFWKTRKMILLR